MVLLLVVLLLMVQLLLLLVLVLVLLVLVLVLLLLLLLPARGQDAEVQQAAGRMPKCSMLRAGCRSASAGRQDAEVQHDDGRRGVKRDYVNFPEREREKNEEVGKCLFGSSRDE